MSLKNNLLLCILDGVGVGSNTKENPLFTANTPILDKLYDNYPHSTLRADGEYVGVPSGQMGNSEVGHITIGTGRIIQQSLLRISSEIKEKEFVQRKAFLKFIQESKKSRAIHIVGLLSDGGIHSHIEHALFLCSYFNDLNKPIYVHGITDGRDTDTNAALTQVQEFQDSIKDFNNVHLVSIIGRYYAMDRDNRWDRIKIAWDLYTKGKGLAFHSAKEALLAGYKEGLADEHIKASKILLNQDADTTIQDNDSVFLFNYRGDRMRQITRCFLNMEVDSDLNFDSPDLSATAIMTEYDGLFSGKCNIIYPPETIENSLGEVVSKAGLKQLRIAETEKYAHVTFFFNSGIEQPFKGEDRLLIPSPRDISTYDQKPEMSLPELTKQLVEVIKTQEYDLIVLNIANADMVGHTGDFEASVKAIEHIDNALSHILSSIKQVNGDAIIIADHGNIEQMSLDGKPSTTHTLNPVPCIYYGNKKIQLKDGSLSDVAPTILDLLNLDIPEQMNGKSLID